MTIEPPGADEFRVRGFCLKQARDEGWLLCDAIKGSDGSREVRLLRTYGAGRPGGPRFHRDQDAWRMVVERARAGSEYHRKALALAGSSERLMIEALYGDWDTGDVPSTAIERAPIGA